MTEHDMRRDLRMLPKAHLHLHFTGSLDIPTLVRLADDAAIELPAALVDDEQFRAEAMTKRGWFRFQNSYDQARRAVRSEQAMRHVVRCAAANDVADGSRRMELQIDPTSYAPYVGGLNAALEIVVDEARRAQQETGLSIGIIVAASRIKHPLEARTLARLAARHAGSGPGEVIAFGLNNDEFAGDTPEWEGAFRIARNAGLPGVPHAGELRGPEHIAQVLDHLQPTRLGHGVRAIEDRAVLDRIVAGGITLEVCPLSNVNLGVYADIDGVPLRSLYDAGAQIALSADDPLLFHARLTEQYEAARHLGFSDDELADMAEQGVRASFASDADKQTWLDEITRWRRDPGEAQGS